MRYINCEKLGEKSFLLGTFFLASALPISYFFYLISIIVSFKNQSKSYFSDNYNIALLFGSCLMIFKNIKLTFFEKNLTKEIYEAIWLDLFNWIPFFLIFFYFQKYLQSSRQRNLFSKFFIAGSIPVLISCLLQYWFKIYGPFETFFGLIVWFQKPVETDLQGVSGLFSNQNYTGLWLSALIPFLIAQIKVVKKYNIILKIILLLNLYCLLLTASKNALLGLFLTIFFLFGIKSKQFIISTGFLISFLSFINLFKRFFTEYLITFYGIQDLVIFKRILSFNILSSSRFEIYRISSELIAEKPFFGWAKSSFSDLYRLKGGNWSIEHSHSMPLEIAFNYGIPIALILSGFITVILFKSWKKINLNYMQGDQYLLNKCWFISSIVIIMCNLNDLTYYDGKVSILIWILLSGLRSIDKISERNSLINDNIKNLKIIN